MGSPKRRLSNPENRSPNYRQLPPSEFIQNLLSALQAPQGLKPPLLKSLYYLLFHLSSNPPICYGRSRADSTFWDIENDQNEIRVSFEDICSLSDILFKELSKMFKQFSSDLHDVPANPALGQASLHLDTWAIAGQLNLLLRCCMVTLSLLIPDHYRFLESGQVLLTILRELCLLNLIQGNEDSTITFEKVSHEYTYNHSDCTTSFTEDIFASLHLMSPIDPCLPFLCTMLEVFVDELVVHEQLREYFNRIDSCSSTSRKLFTCHSTSGDIGTVMEVISTNFCLSFSEEQALENFLGTLFSLHVKDLRATELSLTAAIVLLLNPFMLSAPIFLQAHLISLVSEAITMGMALENMRPNIRLMDYYLSAFKRSVSLYVKHVTTFRKNDCHTNKDSVRKFSTYSVNSLPPFESYIHPDTKKRITQTINKLDNSWKSHVHDMFLRSKSDLATSSMAYMKENEDILDTSFRDEIMSILSRIVLKTLSDEVDNIMLHASDDTSPQDICLLASMLKLMSGSLLQALRCLMHNGNSDCLKTLKDFSLCREYNSILGIISCFQQFNISLPIQKSFCGIIESHPAQHKESKLMLLHFLGLLSLSFSTGIDFLVKGCILTIMTLMNLFVFEGGNLDFLRFGDKSEPFSSGVCPDNVLEVVVDRKSSLALASKFQKIQTLRLRFSSRRPSVASDCIENEKEQAETSASPSIPNNMQHVAAVEVETEETCNAKIFLNCILESKTKPSDFDDLADFIECKAGKDYSGWVKNWHKYRKWKGEKMAVLRWRKKKKTWKFMKGKRT